MDASDHTATYEDQFKLVEALHEIVETSGEAEIVRVAVQALITTEAGKAYLQTHPIKL